ncbi:MAG: glycoside hydrolase family 88 protein [Clostridia bacterium]|nr:glycoside hydrolase family 88 protein [Clostridia bacterium]
MEKLKPVDYGMQALYAIMKRYEAKKLPPYHKISLFTYHQGVFLSGMYGIYKKTGNEELFDYIKLWVDSTLKADGTVNDLGTGWVSLETLDFRQAGVLFFPLYEKTHDEKYLNNVRYLVESLKDYPTNSKGGLWHMKYEENQMWLDGLYMVGPLMAMYAQKMNRPEFFDLAVRQVTVMYENMVDQKTGLLVHGWDESKKAKWADKKTGKSQEVWGRAMGWYVTAIVDILDYLPKEHTGRARLIHILADTLLAISKYQSDDDGRWYEVTDKPKEKGNWLENSSSCLFVYAISKAVRKGYIDKSFKETAKKGYRGIINSLKYDNEGVLLLGDICVGTCIDEGTYEHYISRDVCTNDLHGSGAFAIMCGEYEE